MYKPSNSTSFRRDSLRSSPTLLRPLSPSISTLPLPNAAVGLSGCNSGASTPRFSFLEHTVSTMVANNSFAHGTPNRLLQQQQQQSLQPRWAAGSSGTSCTLGAASATVSPVLHPSSAAIATRKHSRSPSQRRPTSGAVLPRRLQLEEDDLPTGNGSTATTAWREGEPLPPGGHSTSSGSTVHPPTGHPVHAFHHLQHRPLPDEPLAGTDAAPHDPAASGHPERASRCGPLIQNHFEQPPPSAMAAEDFEEDADVPLYFSFTSLVVGDHDDEGAEATEGVPPAAHRSHTRGRSSGSGPLPHSSVRTLPSSGSLSVLSTTAVAALQGPGKREAEGGRGSLSGQARPPQLSSLHHPHSNGGLMTPTRLAWQSRRSVNGSLVVLAGAGDSGLSSLVPILAAEESIDSPDGASVVDFPFTAEPVMMPEWEPATPAAAGSASCVRQPSGTQPPSTAATTNTLLASAQNESAAKGTTADLPPNSFFKKIMQAEHENQILELLQTDDCPFTMSRSRYSHCFSISENNITNQNTMNLNHNATTNTMTATTNNYSWSNNVNLQNHFATTTHTSITTMTGGVSNNNNNNTSSNANNSTRTPPYRERRAPFMNAALSVATPPTSNPNNNSVDVKNENDKVHTGASSPAIPITATYTSSDDTCATMLPTSAATLTYDSATAFPPSSPPRATLLFPRPAVPFIHSKDVDSPPSPVAATPSTVGAVAAPPHVGDATTHSDDGGDVARELTSGVAMLPTDHNPTERNSIDGGKECGDKDVSRNRQTRKSIAEDGGSSQSTMTPSNLSFNKKIFCRRLHAQPSPPSAAMADATVQQAASSSRPASRAGSVKTPSPPLPRSPTTPLSTDSFGVFTVSSSLSMGGITGTNTNTTLTTATTTPTTTTTSDTCGSIGDSTSLVAYSEEGRRSPLHESEKEKKGRHHFPSKDHHHHHYHDHSSTNTQKKKFTDALQPQKTLTPPQLYMDRKSQSKNKSNRNKMII